MANGAFAKWITNGTKKPFYARKDFALPSKPKRATIKVCGLGQFHLFINGKKISDGVLDPAWTDYNKLIDYLEFDVTDALADGENVIAAEVGNGWYIWDAEGGYAFHFPPFMPPNPNPYQAFGNVLVLTAHVEITLADGSTMVLETGEDWKVTPSPVVTTNVYGSEIVDGSKAVLGWNQVGASLEQWEAARIVPAADEPKGRLVKQTIPSVRAIQVLDGKYLGETDGHSIFDFGQNVSGILEFSVKGKAGAEVHALPAEKLDEHGMVDQMAKNWLLIDVKETYKIASDDVWENFRMTFTYCAARYVAIDVPAENLQNVKLAAITSAYENTGSFTCDDERYMKIYSLVEKAVEANMLGVHTDCPTIERFAWQEENHLMAPAIMYMKQVAPHWEKFLLDAREAQHAEGDFFHDMEGGKFIPGTGLIPAQAPCYVPNVLPVPGMGDFYDIIGWGSSIILGTYWHYQFYGDQKIVEDNYGAAKKYLAHLKSRVNQDGFIDHGLGDWGNPKNEYAKANTETAFLYADACRLAEFAELLGKTADEAEYRAFAEEVKENYNQKLLVTNPATGKKCYQVWGKEELCMTQAAEAMPLYWGLVPQDAKQDVVDTLRELMLAAGSFEAGEVGQPYIIQTLSAYGMNDIIADFIVKPEHPSYYAFVLDGETTLGEYWETNPRSHCHDMMGHIVEWYYNGIAGIKPLTPGFGKVLVKPYLPKAMNRVDCSFASAKGVISVKLERKDGQVSLEVNADPQIEVTVDRSFLEA
jgi:hypothetical protein